jgi:hypothetical protein
MTVPFNQFHRQPYLKVQWQFPNEEAKTLASQMDKAYIDIAIKVNSRVIGTYAVNIFSVTGERWYFQGSSSAQQSQRRVFTFTAVGNIPHGLNWPEVSSISPRSYGTFTDGTNWYGVIYASSVDIIGQVTFYVTPTNIVVLADGAAPAITSGIIVLEYLSVV